MGSMATETEIGGRPLKGSPQNPARDPKTRNRDGKGTIGDTALRDAIVIVVLAWLFLIFLWFSLRGHNV
jgi:hypothetical protein